MSAHTKTSRILIPTGTFNANNACGQQKDPTAVALRLYLNVTAVSGTGGISPVVRGYDKISGNTVELTSGGDPVNTTGTYAYEMAIAADPAFGSLREAVSRIVPYVWDVIVKAIDGSNYTYSLSAEVLDA